MSVCVDYKKLLTGAAVLNLAVLVLLIRYQHLKVGVNVDTLRAATTLGGVTWFAWEVFKKWLWKLPFLQGWLVKIPNLNGEWSGKLRSTWIDPNTHQATAPISTQATIKQTLTDITIDLVTNEMESRSVLADVSCDVQRGIAEVKYIYLSEPEATVKERSAIHYGAAKLVVKRPKTGLQLKGEYWTGRKTTGTILLKRK